MNHTSPAQTHTSLREGPVGTVGGSVGEELSVAEGFANGTSSLQVAGKYLDGVPPHNQVNVPPVCVWGVSVMVTPAPVDVLAVLPVTVIVPVSVTLPPETFPTTAIVSPTPMDAEPPGSV